MKQILTFTVITIIGFYTGKMTDINPIASDGFSYFASFALVLGLYGSVIGIDLKAVAKQKWLVVIIVTVAVPLQIMATGFVMYLIYPVSLSFLLAVAIDQIDPLSVDTLLQDKDRMSDSAKGILRIWASFDDPVTVLFGFLVLLPLVAGTSLGFTFQKYLLGMALNIIPALVLWFIHKKTKYFQQKTFAIITLIIVLVFSFLTESFLLAAITGLILRPLPTKFFEKSTFILYHIIVFVVGMSLFSYGIDYRLGILLALVEFFIIQPVSALIFFNGTASEVFRIAYSQQNGLTTLLMGIAFQSFGINVLHILLPAIIVINILNISINKLYTWKEEKGLIT